MLFPKTSSHANLGPLIATRVIGVVYHSGIIKPADAPKSLEDLVKPQYRGKVVFPDRKPAHHHGAMAGKFAQELLAQERADKFIRDLAATKPLLVPSLTPAGERITTGETPIGIGVSEERGFLWPHRRAVGLRQAGQIHGRRSIHYPGQ